MDKFKEQRPIGHDFKISLRQIKVIVNCCFFFIYLKIFNVSMCVCMSHECTGSIEGGVTGDCELIDVVAVNGTQSPGREASVLNHCHFFFLLIYTYLDNTRLNSYIHMM